MWNKLKNLFKSEEKEVINNLDIKKRIPLNKNLNKNIKLLKANIAASDDLIYRKFNFAKNSSQQAVVIFLNEIAEAGILKHIEHLKRNPFAKGTIALVITEEGGRGEEVIEIDAKTTPDIGDYLDHTLKLTPREVIVPTTTLIEFFISMTSRGVEAFIPIIKYGEEDIKLDGAGIFIDDKLEKTIAAEKARMLLFFRERFPTGRLSLKVDDYVISYHITEASREIIPTYNNDKLTIKLKLELDVDIIEHTIKQRLIENEDLVHKAERALESALTTQTKNLLKALEECEADALGAGRVVKAKHPERFDEEQWNQDFAQADKEVDINVNVDILASLIKLNP